MEATLRTLYPLETTLSQSGYDPDTLNTGLPPRESSSAVSSGQTAVNADDTFDFSLYEPYGPTVDISGEVCLLITRIKTSANLRHVSRGMFTHSHDEKLC